LKVAVQSFHLGNFQLQSVVIKSIIQFVYGAIIHQWK